MQEKLENQDVLERRTRPLHYIYYMMKVKHAAGFGACRVF